VIRSSLLALSVALVALVAAAPAAAQAPIDLGAGVDPTVVVDATGTAHIAFHESPAGDVYCRIPRGAAACDIRTPLPLSGDGRPWIIDRSDGTLAIVRATSQSDSAVGTVGRTYVRVSADRGVSWSAPALIAQGSYGFSAVEPARDGGSLLTLAVGTGAALLAQAPFGGGQTRTLNLHDTPTAGSYWADLTVLGDGRVLMAGGDHSVARWRLFGGGDVYDANAWATRGTVRRVWEGELVTGPRGTFLFEHEPLANQRTGRFEPPFSFRSFDARRARFRPLRTAGADRSIFGSSNAIQDARGRLHVAADTPSARSWSCVVYTRTGPRSRSWFGKTTVLFRTRVHERAPTDVRVGAAPDGRGVVVWHDQTNVWATPLRQARGKYRPRANQNDRPACTGNRYG
jgi:hypothetical protein